MVCTCTLSGRASCITWFRASTYAETLCLALGTYDGALVVEMVSDVGGMKIARKQCIPAGITRDEVAGFADVCAMAKCCVWLPLHAIVTKGKWFADVADSGFGSVSIIKCPSFVAF